MITWGIVSALSVFATGPFSYASIRFLLGLAEAGFTPCTSFFFTIWFPEPSRAKATAAFLASVPVANILGSLISGSILSLGGFAPLKDWQTLIVLEALPAIVLGVLCLFVLADKPRDVAWLSDDEKAWLEGELRAEQQVLAARHGSQLSQAFTDRKVFAIAAIYFCYIFSSVGIGIWLPQIVKSFGLPNAEVGLVTAIPYACGEIGMIVWSRFAGCGRRRLVFAYSALAFASVALAIASIQSSPLLKMLLITLTVTAMLGFQSIFLALPSTFLTGSAAAGGLGVIVSIGNLGGSASGGDRTRCTRGPGPPQCLTLKMRWRIKCVAPIQHGTRPAFPRSVARRIVEANCHATKLRLSVNNQSQSVSVEFATSDEESR